MSLVNAASLSEIGAAKAAANAATCHFSQLCPHSGIRILGSDAFRAKFPMLPYISVGQEDLWKQAAAERWQGTLVAGVSSERHCQNDALRLRCGYVAYHRVLLQRHVCPEQAPTRVHSTV